MSHGVRVGDAETAEFAARCYLESQYSKVVEVKFSKIWYVAGRPRDVWAIEGIMTTKKMVFMKERKSFRFQIDSDTGDVIGFEAVGK